MKFPERVAYLRKKKGLTLEELGKLANVSAQSIFFYEAGKRIPFKNTQIQLARVLGVKPAELMADTDDERSITNE